MIIEGNFGKRNEKKEENLVNNPIDENVEYSIISGTELYSKIIPALVIYLEGKKHYNEMVHKLGKVVHYDLSADNPRWSSKEVEDFYVELKNVMNLYAPPGCKFGVRPGSISDYGYWKY